MEWTLATWRRQNSNDHEGQIRPGRASEEPVNDGLTNSQQIEIKQRDEEK